MQETVADKGANNKFVLLENRAKAESAENFTFLKLSCLFSYQTIYATVYVQINFTAPHYNGGQFLMPSCLAVGVRFNIFIFY